MSEKQNENTKSIFQVEVFKQEDIVTGGVYRISDYSSTSNGVHTCGRNYVCISNENLIQYTNGYGPQFVGSTSKERTFFSIPCSLDGLTLSFIDESFIKTFWSPDDFLGMVRRNKANQLFMSGLVHPAIVDLVRRAIYRRNITSRTEMEQLISDIEEYRKYILGLNIPIWNKNVTNREYWTPKYEAPKTKFDISAPWKNVAEINPVFSRINPVQQEKYDDAPVIDDAQMIKYQTSPLGESLASKLANLKLDTPVKEPAKEKKPEPKVTPVVEAKPELDNFGDYSEFDVTPISSWSNDTLKRYIECINKFRKENSVPEGFPSKLAKVCETTYGPVVKITTYYHHQIIAEMMKREIPFTITGKDGKPLPNRKGAVPNSYTPGKRIMTRRSAYARTQEERGKKRSVIQEMDTEELRFNLENKNFSSRGEAIMAGKELKKRELQLQNK